MKILLIGYYGFQNTGDEILLRKSIALLKKVYPQLEITILYKDTNKHIENCKTIQRSSVIKLLQTIKNVDQIVFGGGGIFQDTSSFRSFLYYAFLSLLAKIHKKKIYLLANGIGPLKPLSALILKALLKNNMNISIRDKASIEILNKMNISNYIVSSDLAFYQNKYKPDPNGKFLGLSIRPIECASHNLEELSVFLKNIKDKMIFMDFQPKRDSMFYTFLEGNEYNKNEKALFNTINMYDVWVNNKIDKPSLKMTICMRYHAAIYSALHGIPFLALAYDDKIQDLAQTLNMPSIDLRTEISQKELESNFKKLKSNLKEHKNQLALKVPELIQKAQLNENIFKM